MCLDVHRIVFDKVSLTATIIFTESNFLYICTSVKDNKTTFYLCIVLDSIDYLCIKTTKFNAVTPSDIRDTYIMTIEDN